MILADGGPFGGSGNHQRSESRSFPLAVSPPEASGPAIGGVNPPAGAIAALNALTITMTTKEVRLERGRTAPADAEVALVRGSLAAMTAYLLVGDGRALSSLSLYGRVESLVELGEVLRSQKSMLSLRAEEAPPSKRRRRGAR